MLVGTSIRLEVRLSAAAAKKDDAGECLNHPGAKGVFWCMKHARRLCADCARCAGPVGHCKFRTQCVIWEVEHHGGLERWTGKK